MNRYCLDMNIGIPLLKPEYDPLTFPQERHLEFNVETYVNPELIELLTSFNLRITLLEYFCKWNLQLGSIHVDDNGGDFTKLNWTYGSPGSLMEWYDVDLANPSKVFTTPIMTRSLHWTPEDATLVHAQEVKQPSLVQVGTAHTVSNVTDPRRTFCLVYRDKTTGRRLTWDQSVEIFKDYII